MSIREIPRAFMYTCDGCHAEHLQENAGGHYTDSRPPGWCWFKISGSYYGVDRTSASLLCERCSGLTIGAMDKALERPDE